MPDDRDDDDLVFGLFNLVFPLENYSFIVVATVKIIRQINKEYGYRFPRNEERLPYSARSSKMGRPNHFTVGLQHFNSSALKSKRKYYEVCLPLNDLGQINSVVWIMYER